MRINLYALLLACTLLYACVPMPAITAAPTPDPAAIIQAFVHAMNDGNRSAALALLSGDAVVYQRDSLHEGSTQVEAWVQEEIDRYRDRFEILEIKTEGARATGLFKITTIGSGGIYQPNEYLYTFQSIIRQDKIRCLNIGHPVWC